MGGRPPKPVEQHKLDGTYQKCRHENRIKVTTKITTIDPPESLTEDARKVWETVVPCLCKDGLVSQADAPELLEAFTAYGIAQEALKAAMKISGGDSIADAVAYSLCLNKAQKDPLREYLLYHERFDKIMWKFGLTPVERNKIHAPAEKKEDEDDAVLAIIGNG